MEEKDLEFSEKLEKKKKQVKTVKRGLPPILLLTFTFFLFAPTEIFFVNKDEFLFGIQDVIGLFLGVFLVSTVGLLLTYVMIESKFSEKNPVIGDLFLGIIFSLGFMFYLQGNVIGVSYGLLDGAQINWEEYGWFAISNVGVWVALFLIVICFYLEKRKIFEFLICKLSVYVVLVLLLTLGSVFVIYGTEETAVTALSTTKGQFELSSDENIVVFLIDTLDATYMHDVIDEFPEVSELFADFTFYDNVLGAYPTSKESLPLLFTGVPFKNQSSYNQYKADSYAVSPILNTLKDNSYETSLYTYSGYVHKNIVDYTENIFMNNLDLVDPVGFLQKYFQFVTYRYAPDVLKQYFWSSRYNFTLYTELEGADIFSIENLDFYNDFLEKGVSADKEAKQYQFYYLFGSHPPVSEDENMEPLKMHDFYSDEAIINQTRGCLKIVDEYIQELKELDIYDSTTIIVMSDHGGWINLRQCPTVLIKPFDTHQETLRISSAPTSYLLDWAGTIQSLVEPEGDYGSTFFNVGEDEVRMRPYYYDYLLTVFNRKTQSPTMMVIESDKPAVEFSLDDWTGEELKEAPDD